MNDNIYNLLLGAGVRHEEQALPPESLKRGLSWHGEQGFHHSFKVGQLYSRVVGICRLIVWASLQALTAIRIKIGT